MGSKTKIDWADSSWNPVTGCLHGCEYCYARKIAERFGSKQKPESIERSVLNTPMRCTDLYSYMRMAGISQGKVQPYPFDFSPTFHRYKLDEPKHWKKPRTIFVCSMADLFGEWVPDEWIQEVFEACDDAPQHRYIFLTKNPKRLCQMAMATKVFTWNIDHPDSQVHPQKTEYAGVMRLPVRDNWWFGSTIDNAKAKCFRAGRTWNTFLSIEPLTEHLHMGIGSFGDDGWVIIGAETGNRKGKVIPQREWVENIVQAAKMVGVKIFMKESLREIMGDDFRQELPWEVE